MTDWFRLDHLTAIIVTGDDAEAFAQSQLTGDFSKLGPEHWYPMAWCNAKGKALAVMLANAREGIVNLVLPRSQLDAIAGKLPMFAIGRQVEISTTHAVSGCFDDTAGIPSLSFDSRRALKTGDAGDSADSQQQKQWQWADLTGAMPWLAPETADRYLPQMLGLEALGGVSYNKGCYPGQEVIARIHYLGKVKRRLVGLQLGTGSELFPGIRVYADTGSKTGELLWSLTEPDRTLALAVMDAAVAADTPVSIEHESGLIRGRVTLPERLC